MTMRVGDTPTTTAVPSVICPLPITMAIAIAITVPRLPAGPFFSATVSIGILHRDEGIETSDTVGAESTDAGC